MDENYRGTPMTMETPKWEIYGMFNKDGFLRSKKNETTWKTPWDESENT